LRFVDRVQEALLKIQEKPKAWSPYMRNTRRFLLKTFPFCLIYLIRDADIIIVAVA
jgi:hypothetical protein